MRISAEQEQILNDFVCERLSSNTINERLIQSFVSKRGASLVSYFKRFGMAEEREGSTTYYTIKTKENEILMFFSMKCGALFEALQDENEVEQDFQRLLILLQAVENAKEGGTKTEEANAILNKYQVGDQISVEDFYKVIQRKVEELSFGTYYGRGTVLQIHST